MYRNIENNDPFTLYLLDLLFENTNISGLLSLPDATTMQSVKRTQNEDYSIKASLQNITKVDFRARYTNLLNSIYIFFLFSLQKLG